jgi:L,D-transpeptidase YcbB
MVAVAAAPRYFRRLAHWGDAAARVAALAGFCLFAPALHAQAGSDQDVRREIQRRVETLRTTGWLDVDGERIRLSALLADLYERRGFAQVAALARLRAIERQGGWPVVPAGARLELGAADPRVAVLRRRVALDGDLAADDGSSLFDAVVEAAVRSFQHRHGLNVDGIAGPATLAALNVPVGRRIEQVRVNLERARWIADDVAEELVVVNVAGALVYLVGSGEVQAEARAVVGKPYTRTPTFTAPMRYIELNPTWTVPPGIVGEILSQVRRNRDYLRQQQIRVFTRGGRELDRNSIDFGQYTGATFPYVFRQDPGPLNPLGRIKFVFPNAYNVYLHDTPARELFQREQRTFSHGCVRLENPLRLAELLLGEPERWNVAMLQQAIDSGSTQTIALRAPLPPARYTMVALTAKHTRRQRWPLRPPPR